MILSYLACRVQSEALALWGHELTYRDILGIFEILSGDCTKFDLATLGLRAVRLRRRKSVGESNTERAFTVFNSIKNNI